MATVTLESIGKTYSGGVRAVDGVSLEIAHGEFVVLVGPSGCGKSTTLRMIAGLEEISDGTMRIDKRVVNELPARDRDIAMVFQSYALYPHMTVRRNLAFGIDRRRRNRSRVRAAVSSAYRAARRRELVEMNERVREAARTLGIESLLDRHPRELSGGQRQRVAVGRALVRDPKVFLFDEPLSNLDAKLRVEMRAELRALHARLGATMVYVTHDQEEAMTLGDRLVVMKDGVVHQCDTPMEIYDRPANRFVAGFIGTPAMNFLPGAVDGSEFVTEAGARVALASAARSGPAVLGVRPDRLELAEDGPLHGVVSIVEHYGDSTDVTVRSGTHAIKCRVRGRSAVRSGDPVACRVDAAGVHLFEADGDGPRVSAD